MILDILFLVVGLAMILVGANLLTDGASALAKKWGVSDLVVGLTVVAFGTSAPELVISMVSALGGSTELAIGNVVGSNIMNVLAIIGITAMVRPIVIRRSIMTNDIPLVVLSALVLLAMGSGPWLDGSDIMSISRTDGVVLLLFFAVFMRYTFASAKDGSDTDPAAEEVAGKKAMPLWKSLLWIAIGLGGLVFGGDWFVDGASGVASGLGVSDAIIGLTVVAAGTSLPELATSVTAAIKGKTGMAVGNVIGSNIFNIFLVLGASASIKPLAFGGIGMFDLLYLLGACLMFWIFGWFFGNRTINRAEGAVLTAAYVAYILILVLEA